MSEMPNEIIYETEVAMSSIGESDISSDSFHLTVADVYEMATAIGKEFEVIIDHHGVDSVTKLMPKVINVLENLEVYAQKNERECSHISQLTETIAQLEMDKAERLGCRIRYEKEVEQLEETLKEENKSMVEVMGKLQEDNRRLQQELTNWKKSALLESMEATSDSTSELHYNSCINTQLQERKDLEAYAEKLRQQMDTKEKELNQSLSDLDAARCQIDGLCQINREFRRKQRSNQQEAKVLLEEKSQLQTKVQEQNRTIANLKQKMASATKKNEELQAFKLNSTNSTSEYTANTTEDGDVIFNPLFEAENCVNDEQPRFSLSELRHLLIERATLKNRISELEDELDYGCAKEEMQQRQFINDLPVQGPINCDPDDAPWRKQESGIRNLFRVLFRDTQLSPKHALYTLSSKVRRQSSTKLNVLSSPVRKQNTTAKV